MTSGRPPCAMGAFKGKVFEFKLDDATFLTSTSMEDQPAVNPLHFGPTKIRSVQ